MEYCFSPGDLDAFFREGNDGELDDACRSPGVYDAAHVANQLAEWHWLGTDGLAERESRWRLLAFCCCGAILEAALLDDSIRRALAASHPKTVRIGSTPAPSYHEAVYKLASIRLLNFDCESPRPGNESEEPDGPEYTFTPRSFSQLRNHGFRVFGGFFGIPAQDARLSDLQAELAREADLAAGVLEANAAGQPDSNADSGKKPDFVLPENDDVTRLAKAIRNNTDPKASKVSIAREFVAGTNKNAESLLRELRRFPHLLNGTRFEKKPDS